MRRMLALAVMTALVGLSASAANLPMENLAAGGNDIVATAKWDTPGTDIDLIILGPNNQKIMAAQDFQSGPATEVVTVVNPAPGEYKVGVVWQDDKPNMQVPVTVEVKQGGRLVGTYPVILAAGNPNDRKIVATLNVGAGPAPGPGPFPPIQPGPGPFGPGPIIPAPGKDPLGFAGKWIEHWPGVNDHDVSEITFENNQYQVKVSNPKTGPYRVDNVRLEGNALKFTQYPGGNTIHYEVRLQDANTAIATVQGGPDPGGGIIWRRDMTAGPVGPAVGAVGNLVATLKWDTQGTDVDLAILGPNNQSFKPPQAGDVTSGPGQEVCTVMNPLPGDYKILAIYPNSKGGIQTQVTAEVKLGDKVLANQTAILTRDNEVKLITTVTVPGGGGPIGPAVGPGQRDPIGFVGTWVEDWPGVRDHDISVITFQNGQYTIQVSNPKSGPYRVDNVRLEGNILRFTEYPGGNTTIQYSVMLQDPNTCSVQVQGGPAPRGPIVWRRQGATMPGF